jgi:hypothetical protein
VDRSAPIPFSSCPVDRNPLVARGSFNIARSVRFWLDSRIKLQTIRISVPFCENAWHSICQPECQFDQGCNEDSNAEDNELSENEAWSLAGANFDYCAPRAYRNANEVLSADCALARRRAGGLLRRGERSHVLCFSHITFRLISISRSDPVLRFVRSRQRFVRCCHGQKRPQPFTAGAS